MYLAIKTGFTEWVRRLEAGSTEGVWRISGKRATLQGATDRFGVGSVVDLVKDEADYDIPGAPCSRKESGTGKNNAPSPAVLA